MCKQHSRHHNSHRYGVDGCTGIDAGSPRHSSGSQCFSLRRLCNRHHHRQRMHPDQRRNQGTLPHQSHSRIPRLLHGCGQVTSLTSSRSEATNQTPPIRRLSQPERQCSRFRGRALAPSARAIPPDSSCSMSTRPLRKNSRGRAQTPPSPSCERNDSVSVKYA